jgi:hypothetical protein
MPRRNPLNPILLQMMNDPEYSDLRFVCRGHEFKVHKNVVCGHSPMIKAAVTGRKFKVCAQTRLWPFFEVVAFEGGVLTVFV